jgi:hypothetical protein
VGIARIVRNYAKNVVNRSEKNSQTSLDIRCQFDNCVSRIWIFLFVSGTVCVVNDGHECHRAAANACVPVRKLWRTGED